MSDKNMTLSELEFINNAVTKKIDEKSMREDLHKYVRRGEWPITDEIVDPCLAEGSTLKKPLFLGLHEKEYNSIDRHTKALGVNKTEWARYALFKQMQEEQIHFLKNRK